MFEYLRDKKKKEEGGIGGSEKGDENSPISPPLDPRLKSLRIHNKRMTYELRKKNLTKKERMLYLGLF